MYYVESVYRDIKVVPTCFLCSQIGELCQRWFQLPQDDACVGATVTGATRAWRGEKCDLQLSSAMTNDDDCHAKEKPLLEIYIYIGTTSAIVTISPLSPFFSAMQLKPNSSHNHRHAGIPQSFSREHRASTYPNSLSAHTRLGKNTGTLLLPCQMWPLPASSSSECLLRAMGNHKDSPTLSPIASSRGSCLGLC